MKRYASDSWLRSAQVGFNNVYAPKRRDDLVVNRNRIKDVSDWIDRAVLSPGVSLLLLSGPAGCGKTITVRVLAVEKGIQVIDWTTPLDSYDCSDNAEWPKPVSIALKFRHFLIGAGRYSSVVINSSIPSTKRKLIIMKDFPTSFLSSPDEFTAVIDYYVVHGHTPIVFICTDSAKKKSKDIAYELFSEDFKLKHNILHLSFLPVPVTSIVKTLKRLSKPSISDELIQEIALESSGDIRKAINDLNVVSISTLKSNNYKSTVNKKSKRNPSDVKKNSLKDSDKKVTGLFHSVGRVLYAKRDIPNSSSSKFDDPRGNFVHKPLDVVSDFSHYSTQFISIAHSNYLDIFSSVDCIAKAAEYLSDSDVIMSEWREKELLSTVGFFVAVGGLMEANNNPVKRWKPLKGSDWNDDLKVAKVNYSCLQNAFSNHFASKHDVVLEVMPYVIKIWRSKNREAVNVKWCTKGFLPHRTEDLLPVVRRIQADVLICPSLTFEDDKDEENEPIHISDDSD